MKERNKGRREQNKRERWERRWKNKKERTENKQSLFNHKYKQTDVSVILYIPFTFYCTQSIQIYPAVVANVWFALTQIVKKTVEND